MIFQIGIVSDKNLKNTYRRIQIFTDLGRFENKLSFLNEFNVKDIFLYVLVYQIYHSHIFGVWYFSEIEKQIKRYVLNLSI